MSLGGSSTTSRFSLSLVNPQAALSCAAASHSIYVGAALGTLVAGGCRGCGEDHGGDCYFNTAVLYDTQGRLVSSYHK